MNLTDPRFQDRGKARDYFEAQRWPGGRVRPRCGDADQARIVGLKGEARRPGVNQRDERPKQFTVTVGLSAFTTRSARLICIAASRNSCFRYNNRAALGFEDAARVANVVKGRQAPRLSRRRSNRERPSRKLAHFCAGAEVESRQ